MKKLLFVILLFIISSCGNVTKKEIPQTDSILFQIDTLFAPPLPAPAPIIEPPMIAEAEVIQKDSFVQKDTSRKVRKEYPISKLDTTSVVKELRKNIEVIDSQQRQLDSLLKMKKKK